MPTIEKHPLIPFLPPNAKLLMLGSFPPPQKRWCMDFFYPNRTNQMWEIFGQIFYNDSQRLVDSERKTFRKEDIIELLKSKGIAIYDTAMVVCRQADNASDKYLEVLEKTNIPDLLAQIPLCHHIVCTGQKSAETLCQDYGAQIPSMGQYYTFEIANRLMHLWRMPSSSRAYPMPLAEKARYYQAMMDEIFSK